MKRIAKYLAILVLALLCGSASLAQTIRMLVPASTTAGSSDLILTVYGGGFSGGNTVLWNGAPLITVFVSANQLTATVPAANLAAVGAAEVTVQASGTSNGLNFQILSPLANVTSWSPKVFTPGVAVLLTVYGSGFSPSAVVYFDGIAVTTTFVSDRQVIGAVPSIDVQPGRHTVHVINGTPVAPTKVLSLSTQTLAFSNQSIVSTSSPSMITLTNSGSATVTFAGFSIGGVNPSEFAISANTCGSTLTASSTCVASLTFTPAQLGLRLGIFSVASDAAGSPISANLTGTGTAISGATLNINPTGLAFGNAPISITAGLTLVLTDTSTASYATSSIALSGTNAGDFSVTPSSCSLVANASCSLSIGFIPSINGPEMATLTITDNSNTSPNVIPITGTGYTPAPGATIVPSSIAFGDVVTSSASAPVTVSLINSGSMSYSISAISVGGTNSADFAITGTGNCSTSTVLAPLQSCPLQVTYTPSGTSTESAYIQITDNATGSPRKLTLGGSGITSAHFMALTWTASASPSVVGYNVYRGSQSGGPFTLLTPTPISGTSYNDSAVTHLATYFYVVTSVGTNPPYSPTESLNSSVVTGTIP